MEQELLPNAEEVVQAAAPTVARTTLLQGIRDSLERFFNSNSVRYAQVSIVMLGDLLTLANLYPSHSMYISRPFLMWGR